MAHSLTSYKILIAEDNKINSKLLCRFLEKWGIQYSSVENGLEAVETMRQNYFDLILMDLQMPVLDGFEAVKRIRQFAPELPIIALTADATLETRIKVRAAKMDGFVSKPYDPEELKLKMLEIIGLKEDQ